MVTPGLNCYCCNTNTYFYFPYLLLTPLRIFGLLVYVLRLLWTLTLSYFLKLNTDNRYQIITILTVEYDYVWVNENRYLLEKPRTRATKTVAKYISGVCNPNVFWINSWSFLCFKEFLLSLSWAPNRQNCNIDVITCACTFHSRFRRGWSLLETVCVVLSGVTMYISKSKH